MAKLLGAELPEDLFRRLSTLDPRAQAGKAIFITTIDGEGWPHPALLSYLEVAALDRRNLRLATYTTSTTTRNMRRDGFATISFIDAGMAYYVKGKVRPLADSMRARPGICKLNLEISAVLSDQANPDLEAEAYISSGITYENPGDPAEMETARALLQELME